MKRLLAAILCVCIAAGLFPADIMAAEKPVQTEKDMQVSADEGILETSLLDSLMKEISTDESNKEYDASGIYSNKYYEIPNDGTRETRGNQAWRQGMISGNGENGVITSGAPYKDTMIFQYMYFNFPSPQPIEAPEDEYAYLEEARQAVFNLDDSWNVHGRNRTFYYAYHPGGQLSLQMDKHGTPSDYRRWTNYETAEVGVAYTDENGRWERRTFTSREDNVTVTAIQSSSIGEAINMTLSMDDISSMCKAYDDSMGSKVSGLRYKKLVADDCSYIGEVVKYPSYASSDLKYGGYSTITYVVAEGGNKERVLLAESDDSGRTLKESSLNVGKNKNPAIKITDADAVYLITKSNRDADMCSYSTFADREQYDLVDMLVDETKAVAEKRAYKNSDGSFSYEKALAPHAKLHGEQFNAAKFTLDGDEADKELPTEELLQKQRSNTSYLNHALMERAWYAGRYAQLCASGICAYRLCGMWTGEFNGPWRYIFTLDANVNLQSSAMNTNHMSYGSLGYITFFLKQADDFRVNAERAYGMHDAIQISVNSDGDHGQAVEYDIHYPFQYWNAGASWCLLPIYEYWQCYGNQQIPISGLVDYYKLKSVLSMKDDNHDGYYEDLTDTEIDQMLAKGYLDLEKDILLPLLTKQANFWEQIVTPEYYMDKDGKACYTEGKTSLQAGEKYMIIPTYSPENHPVGYTSTITANATMDISAARDGLNMTIALEKAVGRDGYEQAVAKWENLLGLLPGYKYDNTASGEGALCEWAMEEYQENNNHRHVSHLYVAWPAYETKEDESLKEGAVQSLINRDRYNTGDATTGHGWVHRALVYARVEDGEGVINSLKPLITRNIFYDSMMTDHNSDRGSDAYCTDTSMGLVGTINEMVLFSNTGKIQLCPAIPSDWTSGSMDGLMARTQAEVEKLNWNTEKGTVSARIRSEIDQTIELTSKVPWRQAVVSGTEAQVIDGKSITLTMKAGDVAEIDFYGDEADKETLKAAIETAENKLNSHQKTDRDYVASAHDALAKAIQAAYVVYRDDKAEAAAIREGMSSLKEEEKDFEAAYDSSLSLNLAAGIYTSKSYFGVSYSGSDKLEVRYTTDGTEPDKDSPVLSGKIELPVGVSVYKAGLFVKESKVKVGETVSGKYMYLSAANLAKNKKVTTALENWGNNYLETNAVDGNSSTRWAVKGESDTYEMELDFGEEITFNSIYVDEYTETTESQKRRIQSFDLYAGKDGAYVPIYSFDEDNVKDTEVVAYDRTKSSHARYASLFDEVATDKVKVVFRATDEISIWELQLFNLKAAEPPKEPENPEPPAPSKKQVSIEGKKEYTKEYGAKGFRLDTSCAGTADGKLKFVSDNPGVAKVSSNGTVSIKAAGKAVITVSLVSDTYMAKEYKINIKVKPSRVSVSSVKSKKKKQVTVSWKKLAAKQGISGYQIMYSTKKNFKSSPKTVNVKKTAKTYTVKKLKSKKKYYVRIRAYKTLSGKTKLYGAWRKVKSVKVK